jgi:hypothetical protein
LRRGKLRCSWSVHSALLLACSLLFAVPREASAVVIQNSDPATESQNIIDFLDLSYSVLLGRAPDSIDEGDFRPLLAAGGDTINVASMIDTSLEYYERVVTAYYQKFLDQSPSQSQPAVSPWVSQMMSGATDEEVIAALMGSPEYQEVWDITTPAELIDQMYHDLLGRPPTPADSAQWQNVLSSSNAMTVALDIENSTEYRSDLIAQLYQDDLDRLPDPTGVSHYLGLLAGGDTDEQVIAQLVGSAEFLADAEQLGGSDDSLRMLEFRRQLNGVPEPPALWLVAIGMVCFAGLRRFRPAGNDGGSQPPLSLAIGGWKASPVSHGK